MKKIILIIISLYIFIPYSKLYSDEPIGGMYFSYYSKNGETAKLEFNIAERNISNISLDLKYLDRTSAGAKKYREKIILCNSADYGTRKDYPPISSTCISSGLNLYLMGNTDLIILKKRSKNGIIANLKILKYKYKKSFYEQLKINPDHTIEEHVSFVNEKIKNDKIRADKEALIKERLKKKLILEKERKLKIEKEARDKLKREKAEKEARLKAEKISKDNAEKAKQLKIEKQKKEKAKKEAKEKLEREKKLKDAMIIKEKTQYWNKELEFYLINIQSFLKTNPNTIDNFKLIKVLSPVSNIKNKSDLNKLDLIKINDLVNFIKNNVEISNYIEKKYNDKLKIIENNIIVEKEKLKLFLNFLYNFVNENPLDKRAVKLIELYEVHIKGLKLYKLSVIKNHISSIKIELKDNNLWGNFIKYEAILLQIKKDEEAKITKNKLEREAQLKLEKEAAEQEALLKAEKIAKDIAREKAIREAEIKKEREIANRKAQVINIKEKIQLHRNTLINNINKQNENKYINAIPLHSLIEDYTIYNSDDFWTYATIIYIDYKVNEVNAKKHISYLKLESNIYTCYMYSGFEDLKAIDIGMDIAFKNIDYSSIYEGYCGSYNKALLKFNKIKHIPPQDIERVKSITVDDYFSLNLRYFDLLNIKIMGIISEPPVIIESDNIMTASNVTIKGLNNKRTITCMAYGSIKSKDIYIATSKIMNTLKVGDKVTCIGSFISHDWLPDYREEKQIFYTTNIKKN